MMTGGGALQPLLPSSIAQQNDFYLGSEGLDVAPNPTSFNHQVG